MIAGCNLLYKNILKLLRDMHFPGFAVGFHPTGGIHGIAPEVIGEFLLSDDSRHHITGMNSDADADTFAGGNRGKFL